MSRKRLIASCLWFIVLNAACSDASQQHLARGEDGAALVDNRAPRWPDADFWDAGTTPVLAVGKEDGGDAYTFERIDQVLPLPKDQWLVVDGRAREMRVFDNTGTHTRTIGKPGRGPGEFQEISGAVLTHDSLFVLDGALQRLSVFTVDGRLVRTLPIEPTGNPIFRLSLYRLAGFLGKDYVFLAWWFPADMRPKPVSYWDAGSTFLYSADGKRKAVVAEPSGMDTYSTPHRAGSVIFGRFSSGVATGRQIVMTDGGAPEFRVYDGPGPPIQRVRWKQPRVPVDRQMVDQLRQLHADLAHSTDGEWGAADYYPSISNLLVDPDGHIWAEQWKANSSDPATWNVFAENGDWLGRVDFPSRFRVKTITRSSAAGVWQDVSTGVQTVRIYPVRRSRTEGKP